MTTRIPQQLVRRRIARLQEELNDLLEIADAPDALNADPAHVLDVDGVPGPEVDTHIGASSRRDLEPHSGGQRDTSVACGGASEQEIRAILRKTPMGLLICKLKSQGRLVLTGMNTAAERMLEIDCASIVGKSIEQVFPHLGATDFPARCKQVGQQGGAWSIQGLKFTPDSGDVFDAVIFQSLPNTVVAQLVEVSERIQSQLQREELEAQLQRSRQMEAVGLLAGGVAHDLNNILSGIVTYPDILVADLDSEDPMVKPLEEIREAGQRAADVVSDLLTIARSGTMERIHLDLNDLVNGYLGSFEYRQLTQIHPSVAVETKLQARRPFIIGSTVTLRRAVMNLVSNAVESCEGTGRVTISTRREYVDRPRAGYDRVAVGDYLILTVEDSGVGIAPENLLRLFEPFYSRKMLGRSGTGLGLTVVWNIVRDHEGYVHVDSNANGSRFDLYLPASLSATTPSREQPSLETLLGQRQRILIIDDEPRQREISLLMLRRLGYQPRAVASGEEALTALEEEPADLLLLDMIMPYTLSGRESYLRILERHPFQRAIITSGYAENDDVRVTQEAGAGAFVRKPFTLTALGIAIKQELERDQ